MADLSETLKKHKVAVAVGAAGLVLMYILLRSGSSSSSGSGALQIAQLQASQNLQQAQIQAQENETATSASVQDTQTAASLDAQQNQLAVETALTANQQGSQFTLANESLNAEIAAQQQQDTLVGQVGGQIAGELPHLAGHQAIQESLLNELALLEGTGSGLPSFNSTIAGQGVSGTNSNNLLLQELLSGGGNALEAIPSFL